MAISRTLLRSEAGRLNGNTIARALSKMLRLALRSHPPWRCSWPRGTEREKFQSFTRYYFSFPKNALSSDGAFLFLSGLSSSPPDNDVCKCSFDYESCASGVEQQYRMYPSKLGQIGMGEHWPGIRITVTRHRAWLGSLCL